MKILHRIKFWIARQRGLVAKKSVTTVIEDIDIESRKRMLEDQYNIEKDPLKRKKIDLEYRDLERFAKTLRKDSGL